MFKSRFVRIALAVILPALSFAGSTAQANVRFTLPGAACQFGTEEGRAALPQDPGSGRFVSYQDAEFGLWYLRNNFTNAAMFMTCPVLRTLPLSTEGMSDLEIRFKGPGIDVPTPVDCTAYSMRSDGTVADSAVKSGTVNPGVPVPGTVFGTPGSVKYPVTTLDFANALNVSTSKGTYVVECSLKAGVSIMSVYGSEVDGVDNN